MPAKSRKNKNRASQRKRPTAVTAAPVVASTSTAAPATTPASVRTSPPPGRSVSPAYAYIRSDIRRIGLISVLCLIILAVCYFLLR